MNDYCDKTVLITGGTGTFGNNFVDNALSKNIFKKIVILSRDEFKQFNMKSRLESKFSSINGRVNFIIGDIRDEARLETAFRGVDFVINAAALKHVPVCEYNPQEAVKTNVMGTMNVCSAASKAGVSKVVHLSTDKACEPINFYGSTKQLAEKYVVHSNNFSFGTRLSSVRYGNIIGSRGSIVETILKMVDSKKPINITDPEMTRFWLPINQAVEMVLWTLDNMLGGEVVIPFAGSSDIVSMSRIVCRAANKEFKYTVGGTRPGEKIHEQLMARNEFTRSRISNCKNYVIVPPEDPGWDYKLIDKLADLYPTQSRRTSFSSSDEDFLLDDEHLFDLVKEYCNA
ncbi:MAG: SDR family NAD(P)-dependent oxidoreductase [Caulobacteraceae bacterium]|nr:SDR family NAD(P)-dependent oxidoreductase [Caulobacteraceae bacterium]